MLPLEKSLDCHSSEQVQVPAAIISLYFQSPKEQRLKGKKKKKNNLVHPQHTCMTEGKSHLCYFIFGSPKVTQMCLVANEPTFLE